MSDPPAEYGPLRCAHARPDDGHDRDVRSPYLRHTVRLPIRPRRCPRHPPPRPRRRTLRGRAGVPLRPGLRHDRGRCADHRCCAFGVLRRSSRDGVWRGNRHPPRDVDHLCRRQRLRVVQRLPPRTTSTGSTRSIPESPSKSYRKPMRGGPRWPHPSECRTTCGNATPTRAR